MIKLNTRVGFQAGRVGVEASRAGICTSRVGNLVGRAGTRAIAVLALGILLSACSANGSGDSDANGTFGPASISDPLPTIALDVSPQSLQSGETAVIRWNSSNATNCTASGSWAGSQSVDNVNGVSTGALAAGTHSYGLTCVGDGGSSSAVGTVAVGQTEAPEIDLQLQPASIRPGDSATLTWSTVNATECTGISNVGNDGWSGTRATSDSRGIRIGPFPTAGTYEYTLECKGAAGTGTDTRLLTVSTTAAAAPPVVTVTANPTQVQPGQTSTLTWSVSNADSCSASGGTGSDGWSGTKPTSSTGTSIGPFSAAGSYTYTLNCSGPGGSISNQATIVAASTTTSTGPTVDVTVDPGTLTAGVSAAISWTSANVDSCTASGSWSGSQTLTGTSVATGALTVPGVYSYTLTCTGTQGSVTDTAVLTVNPPPASVLTFDATPAAVTVGASTTLAWTTLTADNCTASGGTGSDGWSGTKAATGSSSIGPFASAGTFTYTLACTGPGGASGLRSATVTVAPAPVAATVATFSATPNAIQVGDTLSLAWSTVGATSCNATGGTGSDGWTGTVATSNAGLTVGPINASGAYSYTLTCTGAGGASAPATVSVSVGAVPPPPSILTFNADVLSLLVGANVSLSWTTANATSCTAVNGAGGDGWTGVLAALNAGLSVGPILTSGVKTYSLVCTGPGGTSAVASVDVTVNPVPVPALITAFAALPNSIQAGQSLTLTWASINSTSCTASGGAPGDGWGGTVGAINAALPVGPIATAGTYTYTLACTGPGGTSTSSSTTVTVSPAPAGPPTVSLLANDANPAQLQPGQSLTLKWTTTNATACVASGGTLLDGWAGLQPTSSYGNSLGVIASPGIYTYTLTCTGPGGTASSSVVTTVVPTAAADCGLNVPTVALRGPAASVSTAVNGVCLFGCGVTNASRVIDADPNNFASMNVGVGVAAFDSLRVTDNTVSYPAGRKVGFLVAQPGQLLSLGVLGHISVRTYLNGAPQEIASAANLLEVSALGLFANPEEGFVGFTASKPFNAARLDVGSLVGVSTTMNVYGACVTLQ